MKKSESGTDPAISAQIDQKIAELGDWRTQTLGRMRQLIKEADPEIVEELKWMGTPTWSHDGIVCTGESYKGKVKLTFARAPRSRMRPACSTRASRAMRGARSTSAKARRWMRWPSRRCSRRRWRST